MKTKHIVICVHGIRTGAENWSDGYRRHNEPSHPEVSIEEYDYGCILGAQMYACGAAPALGWRRMDNMASWTRNMLKEYPVGTSYSFASHSFGTWLSHGMLNRHKDIQPEANVIIGSVLSEFYSKTKFPIMIDRKQVDRMLVLWSKGDDIVKWLSNYPFGKNGIKGFIDKTPDCVFQMEHKGGHSDYFSKKKRDKTFDLITNFCLKGTL